MRSRIMIETSIVVRLLGKLWRDYGYFEEVLGSASETSLTYKVMLKFWNKVKMYFRYSFLGRVSEMDKGDITFIISESKVIKRIRDSGNKLTKGLIFNFKVSVLNKLREELKDKFYLYPLKVIGTIIIASTITNTCLTVLLKKESTLVVWIIRAMVLFVGLTGLNSNLDWLVVRNNSIIFKLILRENVRDLRKNKS